MNYQWNQLKVGDTFVLGCYAPEGDYEKLPITWQVLQKEEDRMLVLSEKVLDLQPFHREERPLRWEDCDLRRWLNEEFWHAAFSAEEQQRICQPEAEDDPMGEFMWQMFDLETATSTIADRVFLLSHADIVEYFPGEDHFFPGAEAEATDNVERMNSYEMCWWLRSSMKNWGMAMIVSPCASVGVSMISEENCQGVRPAMWVKL